MNRTMSSTQPQSDSDFSSPHSHVPSSSYARADASSMSFTRGGGGALVPSVGYAERARTGTVTAATATAMTNNLTASHPYQHPHHPSALTHSHSHLYMHSSGDRNSDDLSQRVRRAIEPNSAPSSPSRVHTAEGAMVMPMAMSANPMMSAVPPTRSRIRSSNSTVMESRQRRPSSRSTSRSPSHPRPSPPVPPVPLPASPVRSSAGDEKNRRARHPSTLPHSHSRSLSSTSAFNSSLLGLEDEYPVSAALRHDDGWASGMSSSMQTSGRSRGRIHSHIHASSASTSSRLLSPSPPRPALPAHIVQSRAFLASVDPRQCSLSYWLQKKNAATATTPSKSTSASATFASDDGLTMSRGASTDLSATRIMLVGKTIQQFDSDPAAIPSRYRHVDTLLLGNNYIDSTNHLPTILPNLRVLSLANNCILSFRDIDSLRHLAKLENVYLDGNPVSHLPNYRAHLIDMLPNLQVLDGKRIAPDERVRAHELLSKEKSYLHSMVSNALHLLRLRHCVLQLRLDAELLHFAYGRVGVLNRQTPPFYADSLSKMDSETFVNMVSNSYAVATGDEELKQRLRDRCMRKVHTKWMENYKHLLSLDANHKSLMESWDATFSSQLAAQHSTAQHLYQEIDGLLHALHDRHRHLMDAAEFSQKQLGVSHNMGSTRETASSSDRVAARERTRRERARVAFNAAAHDAATSLDGLPSSPSVRAASRTPPNEQQCLQVGEKGVAGNSGTQSSPPMRRSAIRRSMPAAPSVSSSMVASSPSGSKRCVSAERARRARALAGLKQRVQGLRAASVKAKPTASSTNKRQIQSPIRKAIPYAQMVSKVQAVLKPWEGSRHSRSRMQDGAEAEDAGEYEEEEEHQTTPQHAGLRDQHPHVRHQHEQEQHDTQHTHSSMTFLHEPKQLTADQGLHSSTLLPSTPFASTSDVHVSIGPYGSMHSDFPAQDDMDMAAGNGNGNDGTANFSIHHQADTPIQRSTPPQPHPLHTSMSESFPPHSPPKSTHGSADEMSQRHPIHASRSRQPNMSRAITPPSSRRSQSSSPARLRHHPAPVSSSPSRLTFAELQRLLADRSSQVESLQSVNTKLREKLEEFRMQNLQNVQVADAEIARLGRECVQYRQLNAQLEERVATLQEEKQMLLKGHVPSVSSAHAQIAALHNERQASSRALLEAQNRLREVEESAAAQRALSMEENSQLRDAVARLNDQIKAKDEEMERLRDSLLKISSENERMGNEHGSDADGDEDGDYQLPTSHHVSESLQRARQLAERRAKLHALEKERAANATREDALNRALLAEAQATSSDNLRAVVNSLQESRMLLRLYQKEHQRVEQAEDEAEAERYLLTHESVAVKFASMQDSRNKRMMTRLMAQWKKFKATEQNGRRLLATLQRRCVTHYLHIWRDELSLLRHARCLYERADDCYARHLQRHLIHIWRRHLHCILDERRKAAESEEVSRRAKEKAEEIARQRSAHATRMLAIIQQWALWTRQRVELRRFHQTMQLRRLTESYHVWRAHFDRRQRAVEHGALLSHARSCSLVADAYRVWVSHFFWHRRIAALQRKHASNLVAVTWRRWVHARGEQRAMMAMETKAARYRAWRDRKDAVAWWHTVARATRRRVRRLERMRDAPKRGVLSKVRRHMLAWRALSHQRRSQQLTLIALRRSVKLRMQRYMFHSWLLLMHRLQLDRLQTAKSQLSQELSAAQAQCQVLATQQTAMQQALQERVHALADQKEQEMELLKKEEAYHANLQNELQLREKLKQYGQREYELSAAIHDTKHLLTSQISTSRSLASRLHAEQELRNRFVRDLDAATSGHHTLLNNLDIILQQTAQVMMDAQFQSVDNSKQWVLNVTNRLRGMLHTHKQSSAAEREQALAAIRAAQDRASFDTSMEHAVSPSAPPPTAAVLSQPLLSVDERALATSPTRAQFQPIHALSYIADRGEHKSATAPSSPTFSPIPDKRRRSTPPSPAGAGAVAATAAANTTETSFLTRMDTSTTHRPDAKTSTNGLGAPTKMTPHLMPKHAAAQLPASQRRVAGVPSSNASSRMSLSTPSSRRSSVSVSHARIHPLAPSHQQHQQKQTAQQDHAQTQTRTHARSAHANAQSSLHWHRSSQHSNESLDAKLKRERRSAEVSETKTQQKSGGTMSASTVSSRATSRSSTPTRAHAHGAIHTGML